MSSIWQRSSTLYATVGVGGVAGALIRYVIMEMSGSEVPSSATGLRVVNFVGCALLAVVLVMGERHFSPTHHLHHLWRPAMATGVLGGFTSTSSFAVLSNQLGGTHGLLYAAFSVAAGLLAFSVTQSALVVR